MPAKKNRPQRARAARESFFVRIETGDGSVAFTNATEHIGKPMPFAKPRATLAMQVTPNVVGFSLLHLTARNATSLSGKPIVFPRGPLARLDRRAQTYAELGVDEIVVELSTRISTPRSEDGAVTDPAAALDDLFATPQADPAAALDDLFATPQAEPAEASADDAETTDEAPKKRPQRPSTIESWRYAMRRDENDVAYLEAIGEEHVFELPRSALHVSVYLKSPAVGRIVAVSFIGHVGKPGTPETMGRVAAMVLNSMSHLPEFRRLAAIETTVVPAGPGRQAPTRKREESAGFATRVYLFTEDLQPVASGLVAVEFDLENANPTSGRLLVKFTPEEGLAEAFEPYRRVLDLAVTEALSTALGDEFVAQITYDIILGEVDASTVESLREVGSTLSALDLTPTRFKPHTD